jgi:hypothetical protein
MTTESVHYLHNNAHVGCIDLHLDLHTASQSELNYVDVSQDVTYPKSSY